MYSNESGYLNFMVKGGKTPMGTGKHLYVASNQKSLEF